MSEWGRKTGREFAAGLREAGSRGRMADAVERMAEAVRRSLGCRWIVGTRRRWPRFWIVDFVRCGRPVVDEPKADRCAMHWRLHDLDADTVRVALFTSGPEDDS